MLKKYQNQVCGHYGPAQDLLFPSYNTNLQIRLLEYKISCIFLV